MKINIKTIPNFPNYAISEDGKIWNDKFYRFLKPGLRAGYFSVDLCRNGMVFHKHIHRLLLETFVGPCPAGMECCHKNGIKTDNRLDNLRWDTHSNNIKDSIKHGTFKGNSKLTKRDVRTIMDLCLNKNLAQVIVAKMFGVHFTTINKIVNCKRWKYIWKGQ